jgi:hypothetical protein
LVEQFLLTKALLYSTKEDSNELFSVSQDKHVVTYDLSKSNKNDGVSVKSIRRIEQLYQPETAILYEKTVGPQTEEFIMTFNSGLKCKLYAAETQLCRKSTLGPTFTGKVNGIYPLPWVDEVKHFAFSSGNVRLILAHNR